MHESSLLYLKCVRCSHELEISIFEKKSEIEEGLLSCANCNRVYPIISSIPILIDDLSLYFSVRAKLGGYLMLQAKNQKIRSIIKESLQKIRKVLDDTTDLDKKWVETYKRSKNFTFTKMIKNCISKFPSSDLVLEHGCSIGTISEILAKHHRLVFGIDKSFFVLLEAKRRKISNADFFVADSLASPFGKNSFELVVALNVLELIEPVKLTEIICSQSSKYVVLSDPYDYERGKSTFRDQLDEKSLRKKINKLGFSLVQGTNRPSFIPWRLDVNPRLELRYLVDLIIAKKRKT